MNLSKRDEGMKVKVELPRSGDGNTVKIHDLFGRGWLLAFPAAFRHHSGYQDRHFLLRHKLIFSEIIKLQKMN